MSKKINFSCGYAKQKSALTGASRKYTVLVNVKGGLQPGSRYGPVAGSYEYSNEPPGSIKVGNFSTTCVTLSISERTLVHEISQLNIL
jgi:hypothetical protein